MAEKRSEPVKTPPRILDHDNEVTTNAFVCNFGYKVIQPICG